MTVQELIDKLKEFDPELTVMTINNADWEQFPIEPEDIEEGIYNEERVLKIIS